MSEAKQTKRVHTVRLTKADIPQLDLTYRSDTVPPFKQRVVKKVLRKHGYQGKIVAIRNTRVDNKHSYRVVLEDKQGIQGKFLVNINSQLIRFDGTIKM